MNTKDEQVQYILSDLIELPENQMRRDIDRDSLHELAENIKTNGLINPITVRPVADRFELVAGQRRLLACGIARIIRIPCIVRDLTDATALDIMAAENIERRDVDLVDEAHFIALIMREQNQSVAQMAERLKRGEQYVRDRIAIAEMPEYMQAYIKSGELKLGVALYLMQIEPDEKRRVWCGMAIDQNITTRTAEYWAYQHRIGTLPNVEPSNPSDYDAPGVERKEVEFQCAVDGKMYPASQCSTVFIFNPNMAVLNSLREELGKGAGGGGNALDSGEEPSPVGAALG